MDLKCILTAYNKIIIFKEIYPGSSAEAIDFLNKALIFNPQKRMTIEEALNHPILAKIKNPKKEILRFDFFFLSKTNKINILIN